MAAPSDYAAWREAVRGHRTGELAALARRDRSVVESIVDEAYQWTALHGAACQGWLDMTEVLTRNCGANVEARDKEGWTPLYCATHNSNLEVVKYLTGTAGANVEATDTDGRTPLYIACLLGYLEVVKHLTEVVKHLTGTAGANVEAARTNGVSPLYIGCKKGRLEVVKHLAIACQANIHATNHAGNTPISAACDSGCVEMVQCLIAVCDQVSDLMVEQLLASGRIQRRYFAELVTALGAKDACSSAVQAALHSRASRQGIDYWFEAGSRELPPHACMLEAFGVAQAMSGPVAAGERALMEQGLQHVLRANGGGSLVVVPPSVRPATPIQVTPPAVLSRKRKSMRH